MADDPHDMEFALSAARPVAPTSSVAAAVNEHDWSSVSSVFQKTLLIPNKQYYVADTEEMMHAFSRRRSIRARSTCGTLRSASGEDQRFQALREEVALRRQILVDVEKAVKEQRGGVTRLPLSMLTHQYDRHLEQQHSRSKLSSPSVLGVSSILGDGSKSGSSFSGATVTTKVRGASARLYSPSLSEQTGLPPIFADLHCRKFTAEQEAAAVRRLYDDRVREGALRKSQSIQRANSQRYHGPPRSKEQISQKIDQLYHSGMQVQSERRKLLLDKYLKSDPAKGPRTFSPETWERLSVSDAQDQAEEVRSLVGKYANGRTVASAYVTRIAENELTKTFARLSPTCQS
jgi:hypothetical protein